MYKYTEHRVNRGNLLDHKQDGLTHAQMGRYYASDSRGVILVSRAHDPSGMWQGSRALAGPYFVSMRKVFVSNSQPIRFARFDGKSVNRGLPVLDQTRALDIPATSQKDRGLWGQE